MFLEYVVSTETEKETDMENPFDIELTLNASSGLVPFYPLLQRGFQVRTRLGCSVQTFLSEDVGIEPDYIENRIQTVFLDGHPVDDMTKTTVTDGAVLALSAAMPGLVGATMRRGGVLAGFRNTITYQAGNACASDAEGFVTVKLFNLLVRELGPGFLERGVWMERGDLADFFSAQGETLAGDCGQAAYSGRPVSTRDLAEILSAKGNRRARLAVHGPNG
jgi:hypothetical protein